MANETPDGVPISDGFDFPVGPRGDNVNVFATHKIDSTLADPGYKQNFGVWHTGEDWNGRSGGDSDLGHPVYAISHGRVAEFGYYEPSWGNIVLLEHALPDGTRVWSQYAHLDQIMVSAKGQIVSRGQQIGTIGKGAKSAQYPRGRWVAHLHFEIRKNKVPISAWSPYVNDKDLLLANYYDPSDFINQHRPQRLAQTMAPTRQSPQPATVSQPAQPSPQSSTASQGLQIVVDSQRTDRRMGRFRRANVDNWYTAPFGFRGTTIWTHASARTETNWGEWWPNLPAAGQWEVSVHIPNRHATTQNARYKIVHANGESEVRVSQNNYNNAWVRLGVFRFEPGRGYLRLSDLTGEQQQGIMVGFDAARWTTVG